MTETKIQNEIKTLKYFFTLYCSDKHKNQVHTQLVEKHNNKEYTLDINICPECSPLLQTAFFNLTKCPHQIKPKCRKCKNPCYDKNDYKKVAKVMRYSGMKLGLLRIKKFFDINS